MSDSTPPKPVPSPSHENEWFWEACDNERFLLQECDTCGTVRFYPASFCPNCHGETWNQLEATGTGELKTYTEVHYAASAAFKEDTPYVVALVELDEGVDVMANIVDSDPSTIKIGAPVELVWEQREGQKIFQFTVAG